MPVFHDGLECSSDPNNSTSIVLPPFSQWPSLDYNVYASIVGDCAWATGGCPITQQNFIDLIYGAISQETRQTPVYPEFVLSFYAVPLAVGLTLSLSSQLCRDAHPVLPQARV